MALSVTDGFDTHWFPPSLSDGLQHGVRQHCLQGQCLRARIVEKNHDFVALILLDDALPQLGVLYTTAQREGKAFMGFWFGTAHLHRIRRRRSGLFRGWPGGFRTETVIAVFAVRWTFLTEVTQQILPAAGTQFGIGPHFFDAVEFCAVALRDGRGSLFRDALEVFGISGRSYLT